MTFLHEKLRKLRREKDLTQDELGKMVGTNGRNVGRYERGEITPSTKVTKRFAEALDVSIDYLLCDENASIPKITDPELLMGFSRAETLGDDDKKTILKIIDALITQKNLKEFATIQTSLR